MNLRYIVLSVFLIVSMGCLSAQTMRWIPMRQNTSTSACFNGTTVKNEVCYLLEYTPAASGMLTSYTTGFQVTCSELGSPIALNRSCSMDDNVRVLDACESLGKVLLNASGNSGNATSNMVQTSKPVILHQVCFVVPAGGSLTIEEDPTTDLTTSIIGETGVGITEYPRFETTRIAGAPLSQSNTHRGLEQHNGELKPRSSSSSQRLSVSVSPNPAFDRIYISMTGLKTAPLIKCIDGHGKTVYTKQLRDIEEMVELNISTFAAGIYSVVVESDGEWETHEFAVMH